MMDNCTNNDNENIYLYSALHDNKRPTCLNGHLSIE